MNDMTRDWKNVLSVTDHTCLSVTASHGDIERTVKDAFYYKTAAVCIPPLFTGFAARLKEELSGKSAICTVLAFPNGYEPTKVKCLMAEEAVKSGASEVDMVISVGLLKERRLAELQDDIRSVKEASTGALLKVIIETALLDDEEKRIACDAVAATGADFIKTSTGFASGGATVHDVKLMAEQLKGTNVRIKAAGGIKSYEDAVALIEAGASRLGSSSLIGLAVKDGYTV